MKFKPPTDNVIFLDTEFSYNDPYKGEILSIGLITLKGKELYLELEHSGDVEEWVKENIIPTLKDKKVSRKEAVRRIKKFVGKNEPYVVAFVNIFDMVYLHKLFESKNITHTPFKWIPIDFASILFGMGYEPYVYLPKEKDNSFFEEIGINIERYAIHNALDDARLLREVYIKMAK